MATDVSSDVASGPRRDSLADTSVAEKGDASISDDTHVSLGNATEKSTTSCDPDDFVLPDAFLANGLLFDHTLDSSLWALIESSPSEPLGRSLTLRSFIVGSLAGCLGAAIYQVSTYISLLRSTRLMGNLGLCAEARSRRGFEYISGYDCVYYGELVGGLGTPLLHRWKGEVEPIRTGRQFCESRPTQLRRGRYFLG